MTECPREGCAAVQVLASQLEDSVAQATACLDDMTKANKDFLVAMTEAKTLVTVQSRQLGAIVHAMAELTKTVGTIGTDVAVLKSRPEPKSEGASTTTASVIASTIGGAIAGAIAYFKS